MSTILVLILAISTGILAGRTLANIIGSMMCFSKIRKSLLLTYEIAEVPPNLNLVLKMYFNRMYLLGDFKKTYQKMAYKDVYFTNLEFLDELTTTRIFRLWPLPLALCLLGASIGLVTLPVLLATFTAILHSLDTLWCRLASNNIKYILDLYGIEVDYDDLEPPDGYGH